MSCLALLCIVLSLSRCDATSQHHPRHFPRHRHHHRHHRHRHHHHRQLTTEQDGGIL